MENALKNAVLDIWLLTTQQRHVLIAIILIENMKKMVNVLHLVQEIK